MSMAFTSGILVWAISRTWAFVTFATVSRRGVDEPLSMPAACRNRTGVGGVLVTKVNERSS